MGYEVDTYGIDFDRNKRLLRVNELGFPIMSDFLLEVSRGKAKGYQLHRSIARNTDIDTAEEEVWFQGGTESYLTSAEKLEVVSTSTSDTSTGTGARTVKIYGLDEDYAEISETITLSGTTTVTTSNSYLRGHTMEVITAGSSGSTAGTIKATAKTSLSTHFNIPSGENRTGKSQYTVPAGKTAYLLDIMPSLAAGKTGCDVTFKARPQGEVFRMVNRLAVLSTGTSAINHTLTMALPKFTEKTDLVVTGKGQANDQDLFVEYVLLLIDN